MPLFRSHLKKVYQQLPYSGVSDKDFLELIKLGKISDFDIELRTNIVYYIEEFIRKNKNSPEILDYNLVKKEIDKMVKEQVNLNITK